MSLFKNMTTDNLQQSEDRLGGGTPTFSTDVYEATIKNAYAGASDGGAQNVTVLLDIGGKEFRETVYITKKTGEHYYVDKNDPTKKQPLPGFTMIDDLCLLATNQGLAEQETQEKQVRIYDFTERKEIPTPAQVLVGLIGKKVKVALTRIITPVERKDDAGKYVPQYDDKGALRTRTANEMTKIFHLDSGRTVNEIMQEVETGEFMAAWLERYKGQDNDSKVRAVSNANGGPGATGAGRPAAGGGGAPETTAKKRLFGG